MEDLRKDCSEAYRRAQPYHTELREIYKYYMPFRQPTQQRSREGGKGSEGTERTSEIFDGTGFEAAFNFAGNMQADWMPPFQDFFKFEAGPLVPREEKPGLNKELQPITEMAHGVLPKARVDAHTSFLDLFGGTAALLLNKGTDRQTVRSQAAPIVEMAFEEGPYGDLWGRYWKRIYKAKQIPQLWPDGTISDRLNTEIKERGNDDVEITQYTAYDHVANDHVLRVWCDKDDTDSKIWEENFRSDPWVTPRFFVVPGETFGRGLAHIGLPFVKTTNQARELALKAAAFSIMGIWMHRQDTAFNPDTIRFEPLAFWKVASTGGPLGPTLSRLPVPDNFNISSIVMADEREQIKRVLLDDELPADQEAVRSATEIAGRLKRYARRRGGTGSRIALELITPFAQRTVDILEEMGKLDTNLTIDQMLVQATVTAPAAAADRSDKVERAINWIQMIVMMLGPEAALLAAKVEELVPQIGRWMGIEEEYIRDDDGQQKLMQLVATIVAAQQAEGNGTATPSTPSLQNGANGADLLGGLQ